MSERPAAPLSAEARGEAPGRGRLVGRRILVVGGGQQDHGLDDAPIGNGRAMCVLFAREGAAVAVADRDAASAEATAELVRAEGGNTVVIVGDAAGDDWDLVMAVNLRSHFLGCKHGLAAMTDGGAIVLIGSIAAREVLPFPAYGASKAALESLCRQAAAEGGPRVRANLLMPGLIDTSLGRLASQVNSGRDRATMTARRQGTAWEVAYAALYLLSDEASYVTGQSLIVDGGLTTGWRR